MLRRFALIVAFACLALTAGAQTPVPLRDTAFGGAQWIMFSVPSQAVAGVGARIAAGDDARGGLIRDRQRHADHLAAAREALRTALRDQAAPDSAEAAIRRTEADLTRSDAELATQFPTYADFALARPFR